MVRPSFVSLADFFIKPLTRVGLMGYYTTMPEVITLVAVETNDEACVRFAEIARKMKELEAEASKLKPQVLAFVQDTPSKEVYIVSKSGEKLGKLQVVQSATTEVAEADKKLIPLDFWEPNLGRYLKFLESTNSAPPFKLVKKERAPSLKHYAK